MLSEFFGPSCAPGALDLAHDPKGKLDSLCSLCRPSHATDVSATDSQYSTTHNPPPLIHMGNLNNNFIIILNVILIYFLEDAEFQPDETPITIPNSSKDKQINCNANPTNGFYGNQGALLCLRDEGDVAILERQYLHGSLYII